MLSRLFLLSLTLSFIFGCLSGESDAEKTKRFFPELISPLPLKLELPDDYETFSMHPDYDKPNIGLGVYWTDRETYEQMQKLNFDSGAFPDRPVFKVYLSSSVAQTGPHEFSSSDDEIKSGLKQMGMTEYEIQDLYWGQYPVKTITGGLKTGRPLAMAYLGLNDEGGNVIAIGFFFSRKKENHKKEQEIWNRFIRNTRMLEGEELLQALGFDVSPGKTVYTKQNSQLEILGERIAGEKKALIKITPLTEGTSFKITGTGHPKVIEEPEDDGVYLRLMITHKLHSNSTLAEEVYIPVQLRPTDHSTLTGEKIFEDELTIILGSGQVE